MTIVVGILNLKNKKMKPLFKSQIDLGDLIIYVLLYIILVVYPTWEITTINLMKYIVVYSIPLVCYVIWALLINRYYFYEDEIKIVYLFRFINREKKVFYSDISEIRYIHTAGARQPIIVFIYKGKYFSKVFFPSNSCSHRRFNKRKEILLFLHSKGIPIVVNSIFKRDSEILK
jgi:hypothetical protein